MLPFNKYYKPLLSSINQYGLRSKPKIALVIGMLPWKNFIDDWIFEENFVQIQRHFNRAYFNLFLSPFIKIYKPTIYIWGYKAPHFFINYVRKHDLNVFFLEDGFIRSAPDMTSNDPPLSITLDSQAPYFDTTRPNDLTDLFLNYDFNQDSFDSQLAREVLDYYRSHRVSKYNHQDYIDIAPIYGKKDKYRILVLGQVPHDDSIKYGGGEGLSLIDLTQKAIEDYPEAQIIIKPHPMSLNDNETITQLKSLNCLIIATPLHLVDALETVDHVYTITSLGGFEALLRGKKVTTLGKPFYYTLLNSRLSVEQMYYICINVYSKSLINNSFKV